MNFFVLGLCRSRTAWLANFLTYNGNYCHHEGLNGCHTVNSYIDKLQIDGDSGTGLMLIDIEKHFPDSPKVIIERDIEDIIPWAHENYGDAGVKVLYDQKEKLDKINGLRIPFDDIDHRLEEIWVHLVGNGFDRQRADLLTKLNVQVNDIHDVDVDAARNLLNATSLQ